MVWLFVVFQWGWIVLSKGNKVKKLFKVLVIGLVLIGLVIGLNVGVVYVYVDGLIFCVGGVCVWFKYDGDYIYVKDLVFDGYFVVVQVCLEFSFCFYVVNYIWNYSGFGIMFYYGYGMQILEGVDVYYWLCYGEWNGGGGDEDVIWCNLGWIYGIV